MALQLVWFVTVNKLIMLAGHIIARSQPEVSQYFDYTYEYVEKPMGINRLPVELWDYQEL